jgi:integrase
LIVIDKSFRFTKTAIAALPLPATGRDEYRDASQPGLYLRVSSSGVKTYSVFARVKNGDMERVSLGTADKITPENARTQTKAIVSGMANGHSYKAEGRAKRGEMLLGELVKDYIDLTPMKERSKAAYTDLLRLYIPDALARCKLSEVSALKITKAHKFNTERSHTSANRAVALIKAAFNWAKATQLWDGSNPAVGIKKNPERSRTRYLQPAELARFFAALEDCEQPAKDFFLLALLTGARRANVLAMAWRDIDMQEAIWRIPAFDAKAGEEMSIPLTTEALVLLQTRKDAKKKSEWVFPADSDSGHYQEPKRAWATLRRRAELEDLRIHDLRRTMGSWLVRTGANTAINAKALGHKSMQAAAVYQRIADTDPVREAMQRATAGFMGDR